MTAADACLLAFAGCNALRIAAYFPQMRKLACDPGAAASFSYATWVLFAAANLSTAVYAQIVLTDALVVAVHAFGAVCCGVLIVLAAWQRSRRARSAFGQPGCVQVHQEGRGPRFHAHRRQLVSQQLDAAERAVA